MSAHTPGPWRWVVNPKNKEVDLSRGQYGESVLRFGRWGMNGATPFFRDNGVLKRAEELSRPEPGREHHAEWWRIVDHPDANLIAAAPDLLAALEGLLGNLNGYEHHPDLCSRTMECDDKDEDGCSYCGNDTCPECECGLAKTQAAMDVARAAIARATGK